LPRHLETDETLGAIPVWYRDLAAAGFTSNVTPAIARLVAQFAVTAP
jgi:hypothetical protein